MEFVVFHGRGLHTGERCSLRLTRTAGPIRFRTAHGEATREELRVTRADRGVRVAAPEIALELELVEHLFSAFAGLGVEGGVAISATGPEVPLLDGGALELSAAIAALRPSLGTPLLRVVKDGEVKIGESRFRFERGARPALSVEVEFASRGVEHASWNGTAAEFISEIAPARTFGFRFEAEALHERGLCTYVDPHSVLVLDDDGQVLPPCKPAWPSELARHKLLDLLGDLYLFGGPPIGSLHARRPGHAANHQALQRGLLQGLLERTER